MYRHLLDKYDQFLCSALFGLRRIGMLCVSCEFLLAFILPTKRPFLLENCSRCIPLCSLSMQIFLRLAFAFSPDGYVCVCECVTQSNFFAIVHTHLRERAPVCVYFFQLFWLLRLFPCHISFSYKCISNDKVNLNQTQQTKTEQKAFKLYTICCIRSIRTLCVAYLFFFSHSIWCCTIRPSNMSCISFMFAMNAYPYCFSFTARTKHLLFIFSTFSFFLCLVWLYVFVCVCVLSLLIPAFVSCVCVCLLCCVYSLTFNNCLFNVLHGLVQIRLRTASTQCCLIYCSVCLSPVGFGRLYTTFGWKMSSNIEHRISSL